MALRGEDNDGILQEFVLDLLHIVFALFNLFGPVLYFLYDLLVVNGVEALPSTTFAAGGCLVSPVGCNAFLSCLMHFPSSDLYLKMLGLGTKNRGVQGLIVIGLRHCDVVFESAFDRNPHGVDDSKDGVALYSGVADHSDSKDIVDFIDFLLPLLDLHVYGVGVLDSS